MKRKILFYLTFVLSLFSLSGIHAQQLAFPGAEGFGRYTTGGRGGAVYHVTTLEDTNTKGSFRYACNQSGARTIVFDVSGTIHLTSELKLSRPNVTIAGQTAPGDGICIADYPFTISCKNVIIRYVRFRLGNKYVANHEGDGLGGMDSENIIIDHCSVSWSIDECLSVYGSKNLTVQWCIASQSLKNAGHSKGAHGYGGNWGGSGASYHHNLIAHNESRTPRLGPRPSTQTDERMDFRNNVIYNWAGNGCYGGEGMNVNMVNNYYKVGPATEKRNTTIQRRIAGVGIRTSDYTHHNTSNPNQWDVMWHVWGKYYVNGNVNSKYSDVTKDNWTYGMYNQIDNSSVDNTYTQVTKDTMKIDVPIKYEVVTTHTAEQAYERVLSYVGASLHRDWVDEQMVSDTRKGVATSTGSGNYPGIVNSQDDNKPANAAADWSAWPELKTYDVQTDTDGDGMPDAWENSHGLNPNNAADGNTVSESGYTNLELYMNSIVADITAAQNEGGTEMSGTQTMDGGGEPIGPSDEEPSEVKEYTLSSSTYMESNPASTWKFDNGFSITNEKDKAYAAGTNGTMKFTRNMQFTIQIPEGIAITKATFTGYCNGDGQTGYLKELNGMTYEADVYPYPARDASINSASHTIEFSVPVRGSLTFTPSGDNQACYAITLVGGSIDTGISSLHSDSQSDHRIYNLAGQVVTIPSRGIYIRGGKKYIVTQ